MLTLPILAQAPAVERPVPAYETRAAEGARWTIPVIEIRILPTTDGQNLDEKETGSKSTLAAMHSRIDRMGGNLKAMIEENSRFHGYKDPAAKPELGVKVVRSYVFSDRVKRGREYSPGVHQLDYADLIRRIGGAKLIDSLGAKEIWVWQFHHGDVAPDESNMAGPGGLDVSNSYRWTDDLPAASRTYTLYGFNYARGTATMIHNRGHQLEALFDWADRDLPDGKKIFRNLFCGRDAKFVFNKGRAGDCHNPPNSTKDYDYHNKETAMTDIEDWRPEGGAKKPFNCDTYKAIPYKWPFPADANRDIFEGDENWYAYWMQNMPGAANRIRTSYGRLTDWWLFMGDFDAALAAKARLVE